MEINELLLHLTKKLESEEVYFYTDGKEYYLQDWDKLYPPVCVAVLVDTNIGKQWLYDKNKNNEFKENFYKLRGIKCWVSDCPNKVLIEKGDHEKLRIKCQEKHTRIVCKSCSESDYIHQLVDGVY